MFVRDTSFLARLANGELSDGEAALEVAGLSPMLRAGGQASAEPRFLTSANLSGTNSWREASDPNEVCRGVADPEERESSPEAETPPFDGRRPSRIAHGVASAASGRRVRLTCAVDLEPRAVEWLWSGRVPLGMITMFAGDPKLGKSYVTLAMAAALSRGCPCQ